MRVAARYSAILIGLYLMVAYGTSGGALINDSTAGASNIVKAFQGR